MTVKAKQLAKGTRAKRTPKAPPRERPVAALFAGVALVVGAVGGWFGRGAALEGAAVGPDPDAASSAAPAGSAESGACKRWVDAVCEGVGTDAEACGQAGVAAKLMPAAACETALSDVASTLASANKARESCAGLVDKLCGDLGPDTSTCKMVREKTPSFPASQCASMLESYDDVLAELKQIEAQNAPLSEAQAEKQRAGDGPGFGPKDAKIAIVAYSDFECPFCARAADAIAKLKERYGSSVRFVFRQYPLSFHANAALAAEASLAAHAQGKFWELHDLMFQNQRALDRESLDRYAQEAGLDVAKFKRALDEHTYADAVKADLALGEELGVSGTPTMIVGPERVDNPTDFASVAMLVDAQLAAAGEKLPAPN
jgi:protein-disulfide isomerase